jgi:hypothetical protein
MQTAEQIKQDFDDRRERFIRDSLNSAVLGWRVVTGAEFANIWGRA